MGFPFFADQSVGVDARAFHVAVVGRNAEVIEEEGEHVEALRVVGEEVEDPEVETSGWASGHGPGLGTRSRLE